MNGYSRQTWCLKRRQRRGCDPVKKTELVVEATPLASSGTCAITVAPSRNVTIPVGVPAPDGTLRDVAVRVTGCPKPDEVGETTKAVVDAFAWTFCIIATKVEA